VSCVAIRPSRSPRAGGGKNPRLPRGQCAITGSADRHGVLDAALGPELVHAAGDLQRAALADVPLEYLAVIADALEDVDDPFLVEAEIGGERGLGFLAEDTADLRVGGALHLFDI